MRVARPLGAAWDETQPRVLALVAKVLVAATMTLAAPFLAVAIASWLLERHWVWVAVPAALGGAVVLAGLGAWLVLRWKLVELREGLRSAERLEEAFETGAKQAGSRFPRS